MMHGLVGDMDVARFYHTNELVVMVGNRRAMITRDDYVLVTFTEEL